MGNKVYLRKNQATQTAKKLLAKRDNTTRKIKAVHIQTDDGIKTWKMRVITIDGIEYDVPDDITPLEYITPSSCYINTQITLTSDIVEIGFRMYGKNGATSTFIGIQAAGSSDYVTIYSSTGLVYLGKSRGIANFGFVNNQWTDGVLKTTEANAGQIISNGIKQTFTYEGTLPKTLPFYLFANNVRNVPGQYSTAPTQWFYIKDNGITKWCGIACKNSNGDVGMYDFISQTFFANRGSGSFTAGPELDI